MVWKYWCKLFHRMLLNIQIFIFYIFISILEDTIIKIYHTKIYIFASCTGTCFGEINTNWHKRWLMFIFWVLPTTVDSAASEHVSYLWNEKVKEVSHFCQIIMTRWTYQNSFRAWSFFWCLCLEFLYHFQLCRIFQVVERI